MLEVAKSDIAATRISARASGVFYAEHSADLRGRFFSEGQIIGYVLQPDSLSVRAMLAQDRASLVATRADRVELVMPNAPEIRYETRIVRQVPAATFDLAVPALGVPGGGDLVVANGEQDATRLAEAAFEVELALPETLPASLVGAPVGVRFDHGRSSLARIILREIRLLFLGRFNV
jgi:putative peptide zinc metalloprotease protein